MHSPRITFKHDDGATEEAASIHLAVLAKAEAERIAMNPALPKGTTVIVVLARPPATASWAKGPHYKDFLQPTMDVLHGVAVDIARKNA